MRKPVNFPAFHKKLIPWPALTVIFLLNASIVKSQYFSLGQEPASTTWDQIRTENFRLIYPSNFSGKAQYLANAMEFAYRPMGFTMNSYPGQIPVIFHNNTTYSNAYVPYAPRRIEMNTTPPQDNLSQDWLDQLILHELRHSVQYNHVRQGFTKGLSYIFGEQAVPLVYGLFTPFWFIEGDAVITETALSPSGRGRDPKFEMRLKAQFLDKGIYHYDKATHGSYKNFTPNVYELGYHLLSKTQQDYGRFIWNSVVERVGRKPFTLVPFSHGIYKETGMGKVKLYHKLTSELRREWWEKDNRVRLSEHENILTGTKAYTDYLNPAFIDESTVVMLKTSFNDIPRLVAINIETGEEKQVFTPGVRLFTETLTSDGKSIWWSERKRDPRWQQRDFAVIRSYSLERGKATYLTKWTKLFAPAVSPDGKYVAAVTSNEAYSHFLTILDAETGNLVDSLSLPGNPMILTPNWSENGKKIVAITVGDKGKAIVSVDFPGMKAEYLTEPEFTEIYDPVFYGDFVLFSGSYNGKADIYAIDTRGGGILQVTSVSYGAYKPVISPGGKKLAFTNYTADGYRLAVMDMDKALLSPVSREREYSLNLFRAFENGQDFVFQSQNVPQKEYESKTYQKGLNLFNFHSWGPISINADNQEAKPGLQLVSQNLLSSSFTSLGWEYDLNEESGRFYLDYSYQGAYPVIDLTVDYATRKQKYISEEGNEYELRWFETGINPSLRIPLDLTQGRWFRSLQPSVGMTYSNVRMADDMPVEFQFENILSLDYGIYFSQTYKTALRDLQPRWGQVLVLNYRQTPIKLENFGNGKTFAAQGILYLPGLLKHHGIRLYGGYQERSGEVIYSALVNLPRGLSGISFDKILSAKVDYVFPIFYPDWRLGPIAYFKRFKARLFYDFYFSGPNLSELSDQTAGIDLTTDVHLFSMLAPFEIGARAVYLQGAQVVNINLLFSFNIGSIY